MNEKVLKTLEFDKITASLADYASSPVGKERCLSLVPMTETADIREALRETSDAMLRIYKQGSISFSGTRDIRASLKRLAVGGSLGMSELLDIASVLKVVSRVKPQEDTPDSLTKRFAALTVLAPLRLEIERCILAEDVMADDASAELKSIRRKIKRTNEQIHSELGNFISSQTTRTYLQDALITMRNGRYCVPVKNEYRGQVPGMIHDQSSTGSTLFVEPMAVVKLNNDLRELEIAELKAVEQVLADLSTQAAEHLTELEEDFTLLCELDFIFAKAAWGKAHRCSCPELDENGLIQLKQARHPLLDKNKVVPIDLTLGSEFSSLIVTGPNTGGKTVSLKTVGLLTLMAQAGMLIPVFEGSKIAVFKEVFADIGDEQSIEQSLSTFSSHMTNIVRILDQAGPDSLVLLDELCAGTDPTEGAALAIAILNFLLRMQARTMATTHYSELKIYAMTTEGVENASCEFDIATLRPTYRLLVGVPGKSNAFAISGKLGLADYIIEEAKEQLTANDIAFEDMLTSLEDSRRQVEAEEAKVAAYKAELEDLKAKLQQKNEKIDAAKERIIAKANAEAEAILAEAKEFADSSIREINQAKQTGSVKDMERSRRALGDKIKSSREEDDTMTRLSPKKNFTAADFHLGDRIRILSLNLEGTVSSVPDAKGEFFAQCGILTMKTSVRDAVPVEEADITGPGYSNGPKKGGRSTSRSRGDGDWRPANAGSADGSGKILMSKSSDISAEINLIGMTVDEALLELDKYLDDAYLAHLPSVRIVHGKGTGKLRQAVQNKLRKCKYVKSYRNGVYGEGENGVTIANFV
ncbi:MAG: endonuclease MutS2 [Lachnospiraceae bacterium]|nr:endonuclease MutS2 [Lachnospiraceae bacterium]